MSDKLLLQGMTFYGHYGVSSAEREVGQQVSVDLELYFDMQAAGASDDLSDTLDYTPIYAEIQELIDGHRFYLLEALAEAIARLLLEKYAVDAVRVKVRKTKVPVRAMLDYVAVEIYRERA